MSNAGRFPIWRGYFGVLSHFSLEKRGDFSVDTPRRQIFTGP
jgi:hypothetical protein